MLRTLNSASPCHVAMSLIILALNTSRLDSSTIHLSTIAPLPTTKNSLKQSPMAGLDTIALPQRCKELAPLEMHCYGTAGSGTDCLRNGCNRNSESCNSSGSSLTIRKSILEPPKIASGISIDQPESSVTSTPRSGREVHSQKTVHRNIHGRRRGILGGWINTRILARRTWFRHHRADRMIEVHRSRQRRTIYRD